MKNYYKGDVCKFPFSYHGWMKFLSMFGGINDKYEKSCIHVLKFMICCWQGLPSF
jgi:hypothetical protein